MSSSRNRASVAQNNPLAGLQRTEVASTAGVPTQTASAESMPAQKKRVRRGHRQTTVILSNEHLRWLAETALGSTRDGGIVTNKTTIIKALIDVAMTAGLDLSGIEREEQIGDRLIEAVKSL